MEAKIFIQDLLKDTVPPKQGKEPAILNLLFCNILPLWGCCNCDVWLMDHLLCCCVGKGRVRRTSDVELFRTTEALSRNLPLGDTMEDEEEEEDDDGT